METKKWLLAAAIAVGVTQANAEESISAVECTLGETTVAENGATFVNYDCERIADGIISTALADAPQGPPPQGPGKTYKWERTPGGGWRMVPIRTQPKPGGPGTTRPGPGGLGTPGGSPGGPPPAAQPPQVDWHAHVSGGVSTSNPHFRAGVGREWNNGYGRAGGWKVEYGNTVVSKGDRSKFGGKSSLSEFRAEIGEANKTADLEVGMRAQLEVDERFGLQNMLVGDILYGRYYFPLGALGKWYLGGSFGIGMINMRNEPGRFLVRLQTEVGCEIPITNWLDFEANFTWQRLAANSAESQLKGYRYNFNPKFVAHLSKNWDCVVEYQNRFFGLDDDNGAGHLPQRDHRVFITMRVKF